MRHTQAKVSYTTCEIWFKAWCAYCDKSNWVYNGRTDRDTDPDIEAMKCYACGKKSWLDEMIRDDKIHEFEDDDPDDEDLIEEAWIRDGLPQPK